MSRTGLATGAVLVLAAAGGGSGCGMSATHPPLKVSAAASLKPAFTQYARARPAAGAAFSFAGSDQLAAQIRQGARPDVFASANTELPATLFRAGLAGRPVAFATNRLVLATGPGSPVHTLADAGRAGITLAVGARAVPVGSYTRAVLGRLAPALAGRILANVRSDEPDVSSIVGKLSQGGADAGFVYATDVRASGGRLKAIALPARVQPQVVYAAAVVTGSEHAVQARAFIAGLLRGVGRAALSRAGFGPPPP